MEISSITPSVENVWCIHSYVQMFAFSRIGGSFVPCLCVCIYAYAYAHTQCAVHYNDEHSIVVFIKINTNEYRGRILFQYSRIQQI